MFDFIPLIVSSTLLLGLIFICFYAPTVLLLPLWAIMLFHLMGTVLILVLLDLCRMEYKIYKGLI